MLSTLKLTSRTYLGKQQTKKVKTILQSLLDSNQSFDFRMPVDWKSLGLLDYCFLIKNPMDLGTISQKLKQNRYQFVEDVFDDLQLVWDNCKTYNPPNSWIYNAAEKLERSFKKMVKNYLPNINIVVPGRTTPGSARQDKKPSQNVLFEEDESEAIKYHEQMKFYEKLRHLSPPEVSQVVAEILSRCPSAFKQNGDENAQILVENFDPKTFNYLTGMIENLILGAEQRVQNKIRPQ